MRVAMSGFFWDKPHVGSGQYLHQLVAELVRRSDIGRVVLCCPALSAPNMLAPNGAAMLSLRTPFDRAARVQGRGGRVAANLAKVWFEQVAVPLAARLVGADVVHVPYFAPPLRCAVPVVATVHDLVPLLLPEYRGGALIQAYMRLVSAAVRYTDAIVADSEQSRRDIIHHLRIDPKRVTTVYLAAATRYTTHPTAEQIESVLKRLGLTEPFVYYVGGFDARKNLGLLLQAFARARPEIPDVRLVLAGKVPAPAPPLFEDLRAQIAAHGLSDAVLLPGFVSDEESHALYAACAAFAFPSRYEGFGLPPLEALSCGAPVLCARASSLPEVVGEAAHLLPPDDAAAWAQALVRTIRDESLRRQARVAGPAQAARFRPERMADETIAVYRRVV